jgi:uncharacterized protein HemX
VSDDVSEGAPRVMPSVELSPEDVARLFTAAPAPTSGSLRSKLLFAALVAAVGLGASIMSCVGQSFSLRQARALEGIQQQLVEMRAASCPASKAAP